MKFRLALWASLLGAWVAHAAPVALDPVASRVEIAVKATVGSFVGRLPQFDAAAMRAQRELWSLLGVRDTWWCGAWFGSGFHEDGCQAGLAVAEQLGGLRRPWRVKDENARIHVRAASLEAA